MFLTGCSKDNPIEIKDNGTFAIYFLKDTTLSFNEAVNKLITFNDLSEKPWLTRDDIEYYDWSSHCIYLKKSKEFLFNEQYDLNNGISVWHNKILVVVADNEICYKISGRHGIPPLPELTYVQILFYPDDILKLYWPFPFASDVLNNEKVKIALNDVGLLHEGLQVVFDSVNVVSNSDTSTIEYTYTLINNDSDNLYVFDPIRTGSEIFHFYNNGPDLLNVGTQDLYLSDYKKVIETNEISPGWFTKIEKGKSISRTVILKGYPHLPKGQYEVAFNYNGPCQISLNERNLSDGRYWIGGTLSNYLFIEVK